MKKTIATIIILGMFFVSCASAGQDADKNKPVENSVITERLAALEKEVPAALDDVKAIPFWKEYIESQKAFNDAKAKYLELDKKVSESKAFKHYRNLINEQAYLKKLIGSK